MTRSDRLSRSTLEARLGTLLPPAYQDTYEQVQPVSMGSAALVYDADGQVAWDRIWGSFCDLAMAGGPPHKGKLLEPGTEDEIAARPAEYWQAVAEISRGIELVTRLPAEPAPFGWVRIRCGDEAMAAWLVRAITMENVSVRQHEQAIDLPAGPGYRVEKEIKNVITVAAKTCHYWLEHMSLTRHVQIARLLREMDDASPLLRPDDDNGTRGQRARDGFAARIRELTTLVPSPRRSPGWQGVQCPDVRAAVSMMRLLAGANVLARREDDVLFVPVDTARDPDGQLAASAIAAVC